MFEPRTDEERRVSRQRTNIVLLVVDALLLIYFIYSIVNRLR